LCVALQQGVEIDDRALVEALERAGAEQLAQLALRVVSEDRMSGGPRVPRHQGAEDGGVANGPRTVHGSGTAVTASVGNVEHGALACLTQQPRQHGANE